MVVLRAEHMDFLAGDIGESLSFGLTIPDEYLPDEANPPELKWVNWRWPRYEYLAGTNKKVKACSQFMVHDGVVLQQFTLENTSNMQIDVGPFKVDSVVEIHDLDFLQWEDDVEHQSRLGPKGYGHVHVQMLPGHEQTCEGEKREKHAVASVMTTFLNGKSVSFKPDSVDLKTLKLGGDGAGANKAEIVIAYKLLLLPNRTCDWRNFIIPADSSDINTWLRKECLSYKEDDGRANQCLARLPLTKPDKPDTGAARGDGVPQGADERTTSPKRFDNSDYSSSEVQMQKGLASFTMPSGTSKSANNWSPKDHLEYFAWRHLEHILSVCAIPLSPPRLIENDESPPRLIENDESAKVVMPVKSPSDPPASDHMDVSFALTCGDMSDHRITTSASL